MISRKELEDVAAIVTPQLLSGVLERRGWLNYGGQEGLYARFRPGRSSQERLLVPLNDDAPDYRELLRDAVFQLAAISAEGFDALRDIENRAIAGDEVKFTKDVTTTRGAVPWLTGEDIFASARSALVAGAKARVSRRAYFGNKSGRFAREFLEACLMGQTQVGSYVVTAFAPVETYFYAKKPRPNQIPLPDEVSGFRGREVTNSLIQGLNATVEAIEHHKSTKSLSGFEEGVKRGVSRELLEAVHSLARGGEGGSVTVEWSPNESPSVDDISTTFTFNESIVQTLEKATQRLSMLTPTEYVRAIGWVSLVARPKRGENGAIRLKVIAGSDARTLQVPVTNDQFEVAARAIAEEQGLSVSGRQEKEGRFHYLYDAAELVVTDLPPLRSRRGRSSEVIPGQGTID
jgi:hypothetical protein